MVKQWPRPEPSSTLAGKPDAGPGREWHRSRTIWFVALFAAALAVRLAGIGWSLPQVYEEAKPLRVAWDMWGWDSGHGFDLNPHFFRYPSLVIYLQFVAQKFMYLVLRLTGQVRSPIDLRILWATDKTPFFLVGRTLTALFGAGLVPATFMLARRMSGSAPAWAAAILVAVNPLLISRAQEVEVDIPLAFFVTLGCALALRLLERADRRALIAAGLCAGLAASSKYTGAILLLPCAVALLLATPRGLSHVAAASVEGSGARPAKRRARAVAQPLAGGPGGRAGRILGAGLVVGLAAVAAFVLTSPYVLLDQPAFQVDLAAEREHMALGHFGSGVGPALPFYARVLAGTMLGWPMLVLAATAIVALAMLRRDRRVVVPAVMVVAYLAIVGSWSMRADRYLIPMLPTLIALATAGAAWLVGRAFPKGMGSAVRRGAAWGLACALAALPLFASAAGRELGDRWKPDTRTQALRWIHENVPEGALVAVEQYAPELANYTLPDLMMGEFSARLADNPHRPRIYAVQYLPMAQVAPERTAGFYDLDLYRAVDLVIVTGSVRGRYQADPARFPRQCAFYAQLDRRFRVAQRFDAKGCTGPEIVIYRNPDHAGWFAGRDVVPGPAPFQAGSTGLEDFFFWNMGVNYESGGFFEAAIAAYRLGLRYPPRANETDLYTSIATQLAHCLLVTRPRAECVQELEAAERSASSEPEAKVLSWLGGLVARSPEQFASLTIPRLGGSGRKVTRESPGPLP